MVWNQVLVRVGRAHGAGSRLLGAEVEGLRGPLTATEGSASVNFMRVGIVREVHPVSICTLHSQSDTT